MQHLSYAAQLEAKTRFVRDAMRSIAGLRDVCIEPCRPTEAFGYRNKMQLVCAPGGRFGLYQRHTHCVVPMEACLIAHPVANRIVSAAGPLIGQFKWPAYDEQSGTGLLRHLVARVAGPAGQEEALVVLVSTTPSLPRMRMFARRLVEAVPEVVGCLLNVNARRTNVILGRRTVPIWGRDHLIEKVCDLQFRVNATSFFQVNTRGLSVIAELVRQALQPRHDDVIVDAYCGVGVLSLLMAAHVRKAIGIEEVSEAVENARHNARLNGLNNVTFEHGTVEALLERQTGPVDAVILDPPRKGCAPTVLERIASLGVPRVAYVSCNPATLARDVAALHRRGYQTLRVEPVDLFPQTSHVECVATLQRS